MSIKGLFSLIGMIVGGLLVIPLGMKVIDLLMHKNNFDSVSEAYIKDVIEIPVRLANLEQSDKSNKSGNYTIIDHTIKYAASGRRDASDRITENYRIDKDLISGDYFKIIMIAGELDLTAHRYFKAMAKQDSLIFLVNRKDYLSDESGTIEHPYLVFGVRGASGALTRVVGRINRSFDLDITPEYFRYNAEIYWTYIATKKEFERRFGKQK